MAISKKLQALVACCALAATGVSAPALADHEYMYEMGYMDGASAASGAVNSTEPFNLSDGVSSAPPLAGVQDLSAGMIAPDFASIIGDGEVTKATVSYSNSVGSADTFAVGATTSIGATASASSTPDYGVTSNADFSIGGSSINQTIGQNGMDPYMTAISGDFSKAFTPDGANNNVTVNGIGTGATIEAPSATFTSNVAKIEGITNTGAGSGNGAAGGSVGTTTTASANSSQFVSSFAQAY